MQNENGINISNTKYNIIVLFFIALSAAALYNTYKIDALQKRAEIKVENAREFAAKLVSQKLYHEAAEYIANYLKNELVSPVEVESASIYLADLYFEHIHDYEKAMALYLKVLFKFPATGYKNDIQRRIIECKDRLGRRLEAANDLENIQAISKKSAAAAASTAENSITVAKIGDIAITMSDYLNELDSLFARSNIDLSNPDNRKKLLKEVIVRKVLLKLAGSRRLDTDSGILKRTSAAREQMMIEKLLEDEVFSKTSVDEMSLKLYYDANKNEMRTPDKFDYVVLKDDTVAVSIISSDSGPSIFSSYASHQTPFATLEEISAAIEIDLNEATSEISAASPGVIVKKIFKKTDGSLAVFKLTNFIKGDMLPFDSVKENIRALLTTRKRETDLQNYIMKNFAELNVIIFDDVFKRESVKEK